MYRISWLVTSCLLMCLVQGALLQEDSEGGSENTGCPPLKMKAVKLACSNAEGEDQDCLQPETGTKARIIWKKGVVQGISGTVTDLVCKSDGSWKRSAGGGGGRSQQNGGGSSSGRKMMRED